MLLGIHAYKSICTKLDELGEAKGKEAVKSWGVDFGMDLKHCNKCEDKMPVLHSTNVYECAFCHSKIEQK